MKTCDGRLSRKIELIDRSSERMIAALRLPDERARRLFLKRESKLHIRRSVELWLLLLRAQFNFGNR